MAEIKNPLTERVQKMATILQAAKEAGMAVKKAKELIEKAETGQPDQSSEPPPS